MIRVQVIRVQGGGVSDLVVRRGNGGGKRTACGLVRVDPVAEMGGGRPEGTH
jgi:hypothetical protein